MNFFLDTFESAEEMLCSVNKSSYDIVISDYQMPEMNGIDFLKKSGLKLVISQLLFLQEEEGKKL